MCDKDNFPFPLYNPFQIIYYKGSLGSIPMIKISARKKLLRKTAFPE